MLSGCRKLYLSVLLASGVVVSALISCNSTKAAAKSNFKVAIQDQLDKEPVCIVTTLPYDVPSWNGQLKTDDNMEALLRAGLVTRTQMMVANSRMGGVLQGTTPKTVPGYRYEVAERGRKYLIKVRNAMGGTSAELCYGKKKVDECEIYGTRSSDGHDRLTCDLYLETD